MCFATLKYCCAFARPICSRVKNNSDSKEDLNICKSVKKFCTFSKHAFFFQKCF